MRFGNDAASDSEDEAPAEEKADAASSTTVAPIFIKLRTNHLGVPLLPPSRAKHKFAKTYTVIYDQHNEEQRHDLRVWRLLNDVSKGNIDMSVRGLRRLFRVFQEAAPAFNQSQLTWRSFRDALYKYGLRDPIMMRRLWDEFSESDPDPEVSRRIDFRHLVRILLSINEEPIPDRLALLFDVWDVDDNGALASSELSDHVVHDLPSYKKELANQTFQRIWPIIKGFANEDNPNKSAFELSLKKTGEVSKINLIAAAEQLPAVAYFFDGMLTREPPKADEMKRGNLYSRMRELDAQVKEEVRSEGRKLSTNEAPRPDTAPANGVGAERRNALRKDSQAFSKHGSLENAEERWSVFNMQRTKSGKIMNRSSSSSQMLNRKPSAGKSRMNEVQAKARGSMESASSSALAILKPARVVWEPPGYTKERRPPVAQQTRPSRKKQPDLHAFVKDSEAIAEADLRNPRGSSVGGPSGSGRPRSAVHFQT